MTEQLERKLHALREQAEASVPMPDFTELESRGIKMKRTRYAVGAIAAAAAIAVGAGVAVGLGDDKKSAIEPADTETPVETAEAFLSAFHDADVDIAEAEKRFAAGATIDGFITLENLEYQRMLADADGFTALSNDCEESSETNERVLLECTVTFHKLGSEERGLGPYEFSGWLEVSDGEVLTFDTETSTGGGPESDPEFVDEVARPYVEWLEATVDPDVMEAMVDTERTLFDPGYSDRTVPRAEVEALADQLRSLREEYVASVSDQ